ncbi:MAG TPA: peptide ABC transporter permease [Firmicutes bacterium]|jgi:peptide/nickel transport system permease protein|nr:peptide ABC transporter permease [Bacillota bacterium]HBT16905.1 peptide ABC transporter permease [Bacillota bacterium]
MLEYITRRTLVLIPMLLIITFLIYAGLELTPGDAVSFMVSPDVLANISPERLEALRESLGLNDPFVIRYFKWLGGVLRGDFGYSLTSGVPISKIVIDRLPATIELSVAALLISTVLGSILGTLSALKKGSMLDHMLTVAGMIGVSIPQFFFGLVAILIFALKLGWLPSGGRMMPGYDSFLDRLPHLVLPAFVLGLTMTAGVMRYARASMLDALNKEFIKTARSKGIPEWRVNFIHGFRVALTPVIVLVGFRLPMLIGGSVIIEQIFQWPGIGKEFVAAVRGQNLPLVMMIALFFVLAVLIASFLVDFFTALLDPRVKLD